MADDGDWSKQQDMKRRIQQPKAEATARGGGGAIAEGSSMSTQSEPRSRPQERKRPELSSIQKKGGVSYYRQLAEILKGQIEQGVYPSGSQLPGEMDISRRYKLNRHTVRAALQDLADEGFIYRIRGKGTFVARKKVPTAKTQEVFSERAFAPGGEHAEAMVTRLLDHYDMPAGTALGEVMGCQPTERLLVLEVMRSLDAMAVGLGTIHLPFDRFAAILDHLHGSFSLNRVLRGQFGLELKRDSLTVEATLPDESDQKVMQVSSRVPIVIAKSLTRDAEQHVVSYGVHRYRGDVYSMHVHFNGLR